MKSIGKTWQQGTERLGTLYWKALSVVAFALSSGTAWAVLPTVPAPGGGTSSTNWIDMGKGYIEEAVLAIVLIVSAASFIWVAWMAIGKFFEWRNGKADAGEVATLVLGGAALLLFTGLLLSQVAGIFTP